MSDDSDHAASPEQRAKRQRTGPDAGPVPILSFRTMGPDETTADSSFIGDAAAQDAPLPASETGPVIQTSEKIDRLEMENVRLRVELDELRKQLHDAQSRDLQPEDRNDSTEPLETRVVSLESELLAAREENARLAQKPDAPDAPDAAREAEIVNNQLKESNSELQRTAADLQKSNQELSQANADLEGSRAALQERMQSAEAEAERMRRVVETLRSKIDTSEEELRHQADLQSRIKSLEEELGQHELLQLHVEELEATNATLRATLDHQQRQIESLQEHSDTDARLNEENEGLKDMLVDLGVRDHERAHELEAVSAARAELSEKLSSNEKELERTQAENHRQAQQILSLEAGAKSADLQLKETSHRVTVLEEAVDLKDSQITELKDELHELSIRNREQTERLQRLDMQESHLKRINEDFKQRIASQDVSITEQRAEIKALHRQSSELAQSLEDLQRERQELETLNQSRARTLEERERQLAEIRQRSEQLQSSVHQLEETLAAKTEQIERQTEAFWQQRRAAEDELKRLRDGHAHELEVLKHEHNEELANQLGMQQRVVDEVKSRELDSKEKYEKQLQKLRAQVASLRAESATFESEHNSTRAMLEETKAQLNQTVRALEDLEARTSEERARHLSEKHRLERHSGELEARSSRLQTELDELRRKDKAMDERVKKLEQTLVDQSVELRQLKTPPASDTGYNSSSQETVSAVETMRRELASKTALWEQMRDEMVEYINRINNENSSLRTELDRWQKEESQRTQAIEDSLKRKFMKQAEQLESLASFKEDAQNSLVSVAQEDVRKLTQENLALRREHAALYERAETLEIHANQAAAELARTNERLSAAMAQLNSTREGDEQLRQELQRANEMVAQSQNRVAELEKELDRLREERQEKLAELQGQLNQTRSALQASDTTIKNLRINAEVLDSQYKSQTESAVKYVDMLFFIMKVDRRRIQDLTFVKKHLMLYFPPPVGVFPVKGDRDTTRRQPKTMYDAAMFALAVVRFRRGQQNGSRTLAHEYEKQLRTMQ